MPGSGFSVQLILVTETGFTKIGIYQATYIYGGNTCCYTRMSQEIRWKNIVKYPRPRGQTLTEGGRTANDLSSCAFSRTREGILCTQNDKVTILISYPTS
jgi:hypothetical protein